MSFLKTPLAIFSGLLIVAVVFLLNSLYSMKGEVDGLKARYDIVISAACASTDFDTHLNTAVQGPIKGLLGEVFNQHPELRQQFVENELDNCR